MRKLIPVIIVLIGVAFGWGYTVGKNEMAKTAWQCIENRKEVYLKTFSDACVEVVAEECICSWDED